MSNKPVVVYGASGYTAALIMEFLRHYQIPFIAAGRNKARIEANLARVPGIETAEYEIAEVEHSVEALTELFTGTKVVCNTVGPYIYYADEVMQAAANARIHYTDCGGGPAEMLAGKEKYDEAFQANGKVLAPSTSYMYSILEIAARFVLDVPGIDSLEGICSPTLTPTPGSAQTIMAMLDCSETSFYIEGRKRVPWPPATTYEVSLPGSSITLPAHPWGGGTLPLTFENDPRVQSVRALTAPQNRDVVSGVVQLQQLYENELQDLPKEERVARLAAMGESMTAERPPRENPLTDRTIDVVHGSGSTTSVTCMIRGVNCYELTGALQAATANFLVSDSHKTTGFTSAPAAVGHAELFAQLKSMCVIDMKMSR